MLKGKFWKYFISLKLDQVSQDNFHQKALKLSKNQAKGPKFTKRDQIWIIVFQATDGIHNSVLRATDRIHCTVVLVIPTNADYDFGKLF